jgi:hypothetical protein
MFKPYEFNLIDALLGLSRSEAEAREAIDEIDPLSFENSVAIEAILQLESQLVESGMLGVFEGSVAQMFAQTAVNALIDDGHVYSADSGCWQCHDDQSRYRADDARYSNPDRYGDDFFNI